MSNPTEAWSIQPGGLARELRRLREEAGLTGSALAERLGWKQPKVSKIEGGKQVPTEGELHAIAEAIGVGEDVMNQLLEMLSRANAISREWRGGRADQATIQRSYDERVRAAAVIRNAEISTVPGLLQTREYARAQKWQAIRLGLPNFAEDGIEESLDVLARRQEVLYDATKRFEFVMAESALRLCYGTRDVMLAQLDRLLGATFPRDNFLFGVIPFGAELPLVPQNRFLLLDDVVFVEHFAGEEEWTGARASVHATAMDLLVKEAVVGDDARRLIMAAMEALSSRSD